MNRFQFWILKNSMLIGNFLSNLIGVMLIDTISEQSLAPLTLDVIDLAGSIDRIYIPASFMTVIVATLIYERPIRRVLNGNFSPASPAAGQVAADARRRLLNEPFVMMAFNLSVWFLAAAVYPLLFYFHQVDMPVIVRTALQTVLLGIVTAICALFVLERIMQKWMVPILFPEGGLFTTPRTLRIRIQTRLTALLFATNLIPFIAILSILSGTYTLNKSPEMILELVRPTFLVNSVLFIIVGILVTFLVGKNLTAPFGEIIQVLKKVRRGDLSGKVRVTTNDEIGYTGDIINQMTEGLKEREMLRHSLELAHEVQQNLLPKSSPDFAGLDIAGRSIYCDQTGGDYFDYLNLDHHRRGMVSVLVGDVSGHGVSSALLMATARAFLRLRAFMPGNMSEWLTDVNRQLALDLGDSGQFMTLFFLTVDTNRQTLTWIRAGHDPAILYDPYMDRFDTLYGSGIALGVDEGWQYEENVRTGFTNGQTILIGTDGIWEACNAEGKMFGKAPLYDILRSHPQANAVEIVNKVIDELERFCGDQKVEDDITLIVIKKGDRFNL